MRFTSISLHVDSSAQSEEPEGLRSQLHVANWVRHGRVGQAPQCECGDDPGLYLAGMYEVAFNRMNEREDEC